MAATFRTIRILRAPVNLDIRTWADVPHRTMATDLTTITIFQTTTIATANQPILTQEVHVIRRTTITDPATITTLHTTTMALANPHMRT